MKKRWRLGVLLTLLLLFGAQMTALAANEKTINYAYIQGDQVIVHASGAAVPSDDGQYYLFALKTWETGVGARTDYCAVSPVGETVSFMLPLQLDTPASKLYSRFVVTARRGGAFVPVSTEMYITNPEAVAKKARVSIAEATGNKKGLYCDWRFAQHLSALGAGYVNADIYVEAFFNGGGVGYVHNGKEFQFSAVAVTDMDRLLSLYQGQNVDVIAKILNGYNAGNADMVYPEALTTGVKPHYYALNVDNPSGEEKLEALMSFIVERYDCIRAYIIGNEISSSRYWNYAGNISVDEYTKRYARAFRVAYNAIKSHDAGADVYMCLNQEWTHTDEGRSYTSKAVLDRFAPEITRTGNIHWGLAFHPYSVPLTHTRFWTTAPGYAKLVNHTENTRMLNPTNIDVVINYMAKPQFLAPSADGFGNPSGAKRNLFISEMGFSSMDKNDAGVNETVQAAALVYSYKLAMMYPEIKGINFSSVVDNQWEVEHDKLANGLLYSNGTPKRSYSAFQAMDKAGMDEYLSVIGKKSWADALKVK